MLKYGGVVGGAMQLMLKLSGFLSFEKQLRSFRTGQGQGDTGGDRLG